MATGFPYSRTIVTIRSCRTEKKSGKRSTEFRYYLSSQEATERTDSQWLDLVQSHWSVENRNHWRRDASLGEDRTRMRHPKALANLALIRSVNLHLLAQLGNQDYLPAKLERIAANPQLALYLVCSK